MTIEFEVLTITAVSWTDKDRGLTFFFTERVNICISPENYSKTKKNDSTNLNEPQLKI